MLSLLVLAVILTFYQTTLIIQVRSMKLYNDKLIEVCQQLDVECIDPASALPQNLRVFYDDCHFTELGAELVSDVVVDYMKQKSPFLNLQKHGNTARTKF